MDSAKRPDEVLTGTTLRVYKYLVTLGKPVGPREVQRELRLSSPSLAIFHLEKLEKAGLVVKNDSDGTFLVDRTYLKHYVKLRRFLIPRYLFYAVLTTLFLVGWLAILLLPSRLSGGSFWDVLHSSNSFVLVMVYVYGLLINIILCGIFWFETIKVWRDEEI
ncbi:MAG: helix-turn-helix domain-containing protein [Thaumarchaeota archaeon]|nr:helix-turn-helix domain-containing protein [Nitrososphaerota archaeon]